MSLKFAILGCGNSTGVPAIGNVWGACDPNEPKNRRTRCSLLIQSPKTTLVIDTGPDFREQLTKVNIQTIDAALYTHAHGDHISGMDELRVLSYRAKKLLPIYASRSTLDELMMRYDYLFKGHASGFYHPMVDANELHKFGQKHTIGDIDFIPFEQDHATVISTGYRFGDFAYSTDMRMIDDAAIKILRGVKTWVVDCTGYNETLEEASRKPHASLATIYALNKKIKAKQVYLTSLSLAMDYQTLCAELPEGYAPAFDGLKIG